METSGAPWRQSTRSFFIKRIRKSSEFVAWWRLGHMQYRSDFIFDRLKNPTWSGWTEQWSSVRCSSGRPGFNALRVKPKTTKIGIHSFLLDVQQSTGQCEASTVCGGQVVQVESKIKRSLRCLLTKPTREKDVITNACRNSTELFIQLRRRQHLKGENGLSALNTFINFIHQFKSRMHLSSKASCSLPPSRAVSNAAASPLFTRNFWSWKQLC